MGNVYPDSAAKVSLAYTVGRTTKTHLIAEYGVGEELAMNIFGWCDNKLVCIGQMDVTWPQGEEVDRLERVFRTAVVMRGGWGCDGFTLIAEGYVSTDPEFSRGHDLAEMYANDVEKRVDECLSICHVDLEGNVDICALPFRVVLRNDIEWGTLLHTDDPSMLRNHRYVAGLQKALALELREWPEDLDTFRLALVSGVADESGFFVQYDL